MNKNKPRVLIVEDDMVLAMVEARMLKKIGYEVAGTATTGEEAIEQVRHSKPDAILMDIKLGGGIDGFATMKRINEFGRIPVIYISGHSTTNSHRMAEDMGCSGYLVKPIRSNDLRGALDKLFQHQPQPPA